MHFTQINQLGAKVFQRFGITFNFTFTDPDNLIVIVVLFSGTSSSQSSGCLFMVKFLKKRLIVAGCQALCEIVQKSLLDSDLWRSLFYPYKSSYYYVATALF